MNFYPGIYKHVNIYEVHNMRLQWVRENFHHLLLAAYSMTKYHAAFQVVPIVYWCH